MGIKKRNPLVPVAGGKGKRPSFFPGGPKTTPGAFRPPPSPERLKYLDSMEHKIHMTKLELEGCLERELKTCQKQVARYSGLINNLERVIAQLDKARYSKKENPFQKSLEMYRTLLDLYTSQLPIIELKIKQAKKI